MLNLKPLILSALEADPDLTAILGLDSQGGKPIYFLSPEGVDLNRLHQWITYYLSDDLDDLIGDDVANGQEVEVTLDIWAEGSTTQIYERVDAIMKALPYPVRRTAAIDQINKEAGIYQKHLTYQVKI
jgi:hypothetical protein